MGTASCLNDNQQTISCQAPKLPLRLSDPSDPSEHDPLGRRIYIHQDTFRNFAARGLIEAVLVYRMAARTIALKAVHHVHEDSLMFGLLAEEKATLLVHKINSAWSMSATETLRQLAFHTADPRYRFDLNCVLANNEQIAASCYFSNYYTYATGVQTSRLMFADKNDIATMRQLMESSSAYQDLTLITGNCLVLIDTEVGTGKNTAPQYANQLRKKETLSVDQLQQAKLHVYRETTDALASMLADCIDADNQQECRVKENVLAAIAASFDKGILKLAAGALEMTAHA